MYSHWSMFPSAFPFSCKQRAHTQKWLLQAWRSETKTALSAAFWAPLVTAPFPLLWVQRKTMTENKGERTEREWQRQEKRDREGVRENISWMTAEKWEDLYKDGSQNQFNHPNWKYTCQQAARWQRIVLECLSGCQTIDTTRKKQNWVTRQS